MLALIWAVRIRIRHCTMLLLSSLPVSVHCWTYSKSATIANIQKSAHIIIIHLDQLSQVELIPVMCSQVKKQNISITLRSFFIPLFQAETSPSRKTHTLTSNWVAFVFVFEIWNHTIYTLLVWFLSFCLQKLSILFCVVLGCSRSLMYNIPHFSYPFCCWWQFDRFPAEDYFTKYRARIYWFAHWYQIWLFEGHPLLRLEKNVINNKLFTLHMSIFIILEICAVWS